jgi:hypothetical protein
VILLDEPSEVYHASGAIGSGGARSVLISPALFRDRQDGICKRDPSDALCFGIASHMALLEPDLFAHRAVVKPDGLSYATNEGKAWRRAHVGKLIVPFEKAEALRYMHQRMPSEVRAIFARCAKEVTVRTTIDGLSVQCRPDLWNQASGEKYDLKTIANIDLIDLSIYKHGYYVQDRWYDRVIKAETGVGCRRSEFIFCETVPPFRWRIVALDIDFIAMGEKAVDDALHSIKARMRSGCWDDPADLHDIASPPQWAADQIAHDFNEEDAA